VCAWHSHIYNTLSKLCIKPDLAAKVGWERAIEAFKNSNKFSNKTVDVTDVDEKTERRLTEVRRIIDEAKDPDKVERDRFMQNWKKVHASKAALVESFLAAFKGVIDLVDLRQVRITSTSKFFKSAWDAVHFRHEGGSVAPDKAVSTRTDWDMLIRTNAVGCARAVLRLHRPSDDLRDLRIPIDFAFGGRSEDQDAEYLETVCIRIIERGTSRAS